MGKEGREAQVRQKAEAAEDHQRRGVERQSEHQRHREQVAQACGGEFTAVADGLDQIVADGALPDVIVYVPERVVVEGDEIEDRREYYVGDHLTEGKAVDGGVHAAFRGAVDRQPQEDQTGHLAHRDRRPDQDIEAVCRRVDRAGPQKRLIFFQHVPPPAAPGSS